MERNVNQFIREATTSNARPTSSGVTGRPKVPVLVSGLDAEKEALASRALHSFEFEVTIAADVSETLFGEEEKAFACLVLGEQLAEVGYLRDVGVKIPIFMFLTDPGADVRVLALEGGSDDCLGPRFSVAEFVARVRALCRRQNVEPERVSIAAGGLHLSIEEGTASLDGSTVILTPTESRILQLFMENRDRVLSQAQIGQTVWGAGMDVDPNLVSAHISNLRRKLRHGLDSNMIRTLRNRGYMWS